MLAMTTKTPGSAEIIQAFLTTGAPSPWSVEWELYHAERLAEEAVAQLDLTTGAVGPRWHRLDDLGARTLVVGTGVETGRAMVERIGDRIRPELNAALKARGASTQSRSGMAATLGRVVPNLVASPTHGTPRILTAPFPTLWRYVADRIAANLHRDAGRGEGLDEILVHRRLLLAAWFETCQLPSAGLAAVNLARLDTGILGIRGRLIRLPQRIGDRGILDEPPRMVSGLGACAFRNINALPLLQAIKTEFDANKADAGLLFRNLAPDVPPKLPIPSGSRVTQQQVIAARKASYRSYEEALLAMLSVAATEQILRSHAHRLGVQHISPTGTPRSALRWLPQLQLPADVEARLREAYDPSKQSLRNRVVHANFALQESFGFHDALSASALAGGTSNSAAWRMDNILNASLRLLMDVDRAVAAFGILTASDLEWSAHLELTSADLKWATRLPTDFSIDTVQEQWKELSGFLSKLSPAFAQLVRIGSLGFLNPAEADELPLLAMLLLTFEGYFRAVSMLLGRRVLQQDTSGGRYQYLMLDSRGLLEPSLVNLLLQDVDPGDRPAANRVLALAARARNAFAHGAVRDVHAAGLQPWFVPLAKTVVWLTSAGTTHLIRESAYYRWLRRRESARGDVSPEDDWLAAETETMAQIAQSGTGW